MFFSGRVVLTPSPKKEGHEDGYAYYYDPETRKLAYRLILVNRPLGVIEGGEGTTLSSNEVHILYSRD